MSAEVSRVTAPGQDTPGFPIRRKGQQQGSGTRPPTPSAESNAPDVSEITSDTEESLSDSTTTPKPPDKGKQTATEEPHQHTHQVTQSTSKEDETITAVLDQYHQTWKKIFSGDKVPEGENKLAYILNKLSGKLQEMVAKPSTQVPGEFPSTPPDQQQKKRRETVVSTKAAPRKSDTISKPQTSGFWQDFMPRNP